MHIISVIPISRGITADELTYFSNDSIAQGSIVSIPLRKKVVFGLVSKSEEAKTMKTEIKQANFEMKKIIGATKKMFSEAFISAAKDSAEFHVGTLGSVLFAVIPKAILSKVDSVIEFEETKKESNVRQAYVLQETDDDRFIHYKGIIREKFAKKKSVFMIMPSVEEIKKSRTYFEKGINEYTYVLHPDMKQKEIVSIWNKALRDTHPILLIATGIFLSLPRHDIGAIIIEKENSRGYKNIARPFIDTRYLAEQLAKNLWADIILGDSALRVETIARFEQGELVDYAPLSFRSLSIAEERIVDMRLYRSGEKGFRILSDDMVELIKDNKANNELLFIHAARKGVASSTVCMDCEHVLSCKLCNSPLVLYGKAESPSRFFLCNKCGKKEDADTTCRRCNSWRLKPIGIGTELVENEINNLMPEVKVFRLDKTTATTHRRALAMVEKWYSSPGSVLVGTEIVLTYLDKKIDNTAIASLDSYFTIPDFRVAEKIFLIILKVRALAQKKFIIQTRHPANPTVTSATKGNMADFFREEILGRKSLSFPPFTVLIKISCSGTKPKVLERMQELKSLCKGYEMDVFPAFVSMPRGQVVMHGLIRIDHKSWPDKKLLPILLSLPPSFAVNINPESLL